MALALRFLNAAMNIFRTQRKRNRKTKIGTMDVEGLDEEVEGARQAAARRVAEWLTVPDDLQSKLPKLRANVHAGQLATDAQLRALVQVQLDSARTGLDLLRLSLGRIANVQAKYGPHYTRTSLPPPCHCFLTNSPLSTRGVSLSAVDKLCAETQGLIGQYELIKAGAHLPPSLRAAGGGWLLR